MSHVVKYSPHLISKTDSSIFETIVARAIGLQLLLSDNTSNRVSPLCSESKYIQIETKDELSLGKFIDELQQADIISHLSQDTSSDPNEN